MRGLNGKSDVMQKKLEEKYGTREVFVIPASDASNIPNYFTDKKSAARKGIELNISNGKYILQSDAEMDLSVLQVVPCCIVKDSYKNYFVTEHLKPRTEDRLKSKFSLTFGTHVYPSDGFQDNLGRALLREIEDKTTIKQIGVPYYANFFYGYLRDNSSFTAEHIGVLNHVTITNCYKDKFLIKHEDQLKGHWFNKNQLMKYYNDFENWDRLIISYLVFGDREEVIRWKQTNP